MTEFNFYNKKGVRLLTLGEDISTNIENLDYIHITDYTDNMYSFKFIKGLVKNIIGEKILQHGGLKTLSMFNDKKECIFLLNEEEITVCTFCFYKVELRTVKEDKIITYEGYFHNGIVKYKDFYKTIITKS